MGRPQQVRSICESPKSRLQAGRTQRAVAFPLLLLLVAGCRSPALRENRMAQEEEQQPAPRVVASDRLEAVLCRSRVFLDTRLGCRSG